MQDKTKKIEKSHEILLIFWTKVYIIEIYMGV